MAEGGIVTAMNAAGAIEVREGGVVATEEDEEEHIVAGGAEVIGAGGAEGAAMKGDAAVVADTVVVVAAGRSDVRNTRAGQHTRGHYSVPLPYIIPCPNILFGGMNISRSAMLGIERE
jgi:hypothetical protein